MSSLDLRRGNSQKNQPLGLQELEQRDRFIHRHIGTSEQDIAEMLQTLGMSSLEVLIDKVVPDSIRMSGELDLPGSRPETEVLDELRVLANRNTVAKSNIIILNGNRHRETLKGPTTRERARCHNPLCKQL